MLIEEMQSRWVAEYVGADSVELVGDKDCPYKRNGRTYYDYYLIFSVTWSGKRIRVAVLREKVTRKYKIEEEKRVLYEVRQAFQRFKNLVLAARAYRNERPLL